MTLGTPSFTDARQPDATSAGRSRDADNTRQLLLQAARLRFARDGYSSTTVREIAADAGVNVALINRYFESKEGLFEACLARAATALDRAEGDSTSVQGVIDTMVRHLVDISSGEVPLQLLLLLRSSGDERVDQIRRRTLRGFAETMAATAGWASDDPATDPLLLRAQIALSTAMGMVMLRSSVALEPLASAGEAGLDGPLREVLTLLLTPTPGPS